MLSGYGLHTDIDLDTAVAIPRDFACDVREKVLSKSVLLSFCLAQSGALSIFLVTVMSLKMTCGRC